MYLQISSVGHFLKESGNTEVPRCIRGGIWNLVEILKAFRDNEL